MNDSDRSTSAQDPSSTNHSLNEEHHIEPPNYTQIPNIVFDHWMKILDPIEFRELVKKYYLEGRYVNNED